RSASPGTRFATRAEGRGVLDDSNRESGWHPGWYSQECAPGGPEPELSVPLGRLAERRLQLRPETGLRAGTPGGDEAVQPGPVRPGDLVSPALGPDSGPLQR